MKIAIYHNLSSGGAKRSLFEIVKRLSKSHEINVFSLSSADHDFCDIRPLVKSHNVYGFRSGKLFRSPWGRLNSIIRVSDLVRLRKLNEIIAQDIINQQPDLVFVEPCRFENTPSLIRFLSDLPNVYYCHEPFRVLYEQAPQRPYYKDETRLRKAINRVDPFLIYYKAMAKRNDLFNIQKAGHVYVNSGYTKFQVQSIYQIHAEVNYLGVDTDKFKPLTGVQKTNMIISVGSLTPLKGFDFIIRSISLIPPHHQPILVISSNFSNPEEFHYLNNLANQLGVKVQFLEGIPDEKLVELYNQAVLTAYAPHREPFGLVALESMACATPVVGVKEGGLLETIQDRISGRLVERNEEIFARAVFEFLSNPQTSLEYGQNGYRRVQEKWSWDAAVRNIECNFINSVERKPQL
ncbi:glycosyltransferase family 4 protein [Bellilinea caldifistulae]|uniref:glycosyltransferase family 4 protein n=1 Tax=Bellilinea caldifistulae TaxID=360411 RepID=UPI0009E26C9F|nr:glycosyltransferase family 4 protein [Bellilinea caldifistulae]